MSVSTSLERPFPRARSRPARPHRTYLRSRRPFWRALFRFIPLARVASVPVEMHSTCFIYPIGWLLWLALSKGGLSHGNRWWFALDLQIFLTLVGVSILVHEFAHVFVARAFGFSTERVVIVPFGAVAVMEIPMTLPGIEFCIALAGPLASFGLSALCGLGLQHPGFHFIPASWGWGGIPFSAFCEACAEINLILALFNLLPIHPMDGGRMLRAVVCLVARWCFGASRMRALVLATRCAVWVVNPLVALAAMACIIAWTHLWVDLALVALVLVAGELERQKIEEQVRAVRSRIVFDEIALRQDS